VAALDVRRRRIGYLRSKPDDLDAIDAKIVEELEEGKHAAQRS
jgi:hypothetical protein